MAKEVRKFSEKEIKQRARTIEKAKKTISEIGARWKADPNVLCMGYGLRLRKGKTEREVVISFIVRKKEKDIRKLKALGTKPIPKKIKNIPTDVVEVGEIIRQEATGDRDERAYNPLVGGCATSNADSHILFWNGFGSLGSICFDRSTGAPMALSNWHVWAEGGEQGDDIIQPGHPRTEDRVQAYFEAGFCGPVANLIEWEAPSALTSALYGAAASAAAAAAASDKIDPSRKGQKNTPPRAGEITSKEVINMKIEYLTQPIPGTPFRLRVGWKYDRHTSDKTYHYHEEQDIRNEHVLISKQVRTNKKQYRPGERLELYALVESDRPLTCDSYYAVAYLVPVADETRKIPVVLHPSICAAEKVCIDFSSDKPGSTLPDHFTRLGAEFKAPSNRNFRIVDMYQHDNKGELALFPKGMFVIIPPSRAVEAHVVTFATPVGIEAYSKNKKIGTVTSPPQQGTVHVLRLEGEDIDSVEFFGGSNEASMLMFCYEPIAPVENVELLSRKVVSKRGSKRVCCFKGAVTIDPMTKPGKWNVYLFVQTVNTVPEGTPPDKAAQVIGGLPVSQNMEDASNVPDTDVECGACAIVDFTFEII